MQATPEPDARTIAELSALADGTLDPRRTVAARAVISGSPALRQRYERERAAVVALRGVRSDRAPARLRVAVAALRHRDRQPRRAPIFGGALAGLAAAAVAAVVLLLPGGSPGAPSVSQAAALSLRGPAMAAPVVYRTHVGTRLNDDVGEVYFPDWSRRGWRPVGQRVDRLGDRRAVTVYYQRGSIRIAYTILAAPALDRPAAPKRWLHGVELESFSAGDRMVVTWQRTGHTCVLSGAGVPADSLAQLALST